MNGLDPKTVEAVQLAVKGTAEEDLDFDDDDDDDTDVYDDHHYDSRDAPTINGNRGPARGSTGAGGIMRRSANKSRSTKAETWETSRLQRPPATTLKRRVLPKESKKARTEKTGGRWEDDGYESEGEDMRGGESTSPPVAQRVELEMFGRKVASFGKVTLGCVGDGVHGVLYMHVCIKYSVSVASPAASLLAVLVLVLPCLRDSTRVKDSESCYRAWHGTCRVNLVVCP